MKFDPILLTRKIYDQLDKTGGIWLVQNTWCTKICTNGVTVSQTIVHDSNTKSLTATASWKATNPSDCLPIRKLSQQEKKRQMVHIIYHSLSLSLSLSLALSMFCRAEEVSHGYVRLARSHLTKLKFHQPRKTHFFIFIELLYQ